jgi:thiol:disulfide interchange protein DsbD
VTRAIRCGLLAVALCGVAASRVEAVYREPVETRLVSRTASVRPATPFEVGVVFRIQPGWHVYWLNPGDAGLATSVRWTLPDGFVAQPLRWPLPGRFEQQGGVGYGYAESLLLSAIVIPPAALPDSVPVRAQVGWLACEKICLRGTKALELTLGRDTPPAAVDSALFDTWAARLPVDADGAGAPATLRTRGGIPRDGAPGTVAVTVSWRAAPAAVEWFPPADQALDVDATESRTRDRRTVLVFRARRLPGAAPALPTLESVLAWTDGAGTRRGLRIPIDLEGGTEP